MARPASATAMVLLLSVAGVARADLRAEMAAANARVVDELALADARAAASYREGVAAELRGDPAGAEPAFRAAHAILPQSPHPLRKLCWSLGQQHRRDEAEPLCRQALALAPTHENRAALAFVPIQSHANGAPPTSAESGEALQLAGLAAREGGSLDQLVLCTVAIQVGAGGPLRDCTQRLLQVEPDDGTTHLFAATVEAMDHRWDEAFAETARARQLGAPPAAVDELERSIRESQPAALRWAPLGLRVGAIWIGLLLFLLLSGTTLSAAALRAAQRLPSTVDGRATGLDALVRRLYRALLWACCACYYLSIPIVLLLVVGLGSAVIWGFLSVGQIAVRGILIVAVVALTTFWAVLRSLFIRGRDDDPGERLDLAQEPSLRALLDEVAARVGTRAVDNVYLTPGTDLAVTERAQSLVRLLRGARSERCLILGAGVLDGMERAQLKSVLAHEYGHFQNRDTAGGGFALSVRRSLLALALNLARGGVARWYNPAWWFVSGFFKLFMRISQGASRLQEVLCDRWAAFAYGSDTFEHGLSHVIAQSARFDALADVALREVLEKKRPLVNLYRYLPETPVNEAELDRAIAATVNEPASPYASHPSPTERIALVRALAAPGGAITDGDEAPAWSLFADREAIERRMTGVVRARVAARHGVEIADETTSLEDRR